MKGTVFLLEDDKSICELVRCALEMADIDTVCFNTVADFNAALNQHLPAVALLDIMLPDGSGLDVLKKLKQSYPKVACIMLSALGQESDKVKGLNLGADDYISKPFGVLELTARVNVALRKQAVSDVLVCGNISLDEKSMSVSIDGRTVELNNKEFHLLRFLMRNEGRALSRDAILDAVWGYDEGETRTVDNHIARLRKLGVHNIETVFGVGYKLGKYFVRFDKVHTKSFLCFNFKKYAGILRQHAKRRLLRDQQRAAFRQNAERRCFYARLARERQIEIRMRIKLLADIGAGGDREDCGMLLRRHEERLGNRHARAGRICPGEGENLSALHISSAGRSAPEP